MNWKDFWSKFPNQFAKDEFIKQVGKTVQGQPISNEQLNQLISDIVQKLDLKDDDVVLDLCCGNGLITSAVAEKCQSIVGVDFSKPLIEIARKYHNPINTKYLNMSVFDITSENLQMPKSFTKIYMYEGLQYFQEAQFSHLMQILLARSNEKVIILFAGIPDLGKIREFYNTPERQLEYETRKRQGTEMIGTWWKKSFIRQVCGDYGLQCDFLSQHEFSHTAHYRFDFRIKR